MGHSYAAENAKTGGGKQWRENGISARPIRSGGRDDFHVLPRRPILTWAAGVSNPRKALRPPQL
jgi:hypothetical protein